MPCRGAKDPLNLERDILHNILNMPNYTFINKKKYILIVPLQDLHVQ
jgi:hypothetical protein